MARRRLRQGSVFKAATPEEAAKRFWAAISQDLKAIEQVLGRNCEEITAHFRPSGEGERIEIRITSEAIRQRLDIIEKFMRSP